MYGAIGTLETGNVNTTDLDLKTVTVSMHAPTKHEAYYAWQGNISFRSPLPIQIQNFQDVQLNASLYCEGIHIALVNVQSLLLSPAPNRTGPLPIFAQTVNGHLHEVMNCFSRVARGVLTHIQIKGLDWISPHPNHSWLNEVLKGLDIKLNIELKDADVLNALQEKFQEFSQTLKIALDYLKRERNRF